MYASIRCGFDLPFIPTVFKLSAGIPQYRRCCGRTWRALSAPANLKQQPERTRKSALVRDQRRLDIFEQAAVLAADKFF